MSFTAHLEYIFHITCSNCKFYFTYAVMQKKFKIITSVGNLQDVLLGIESAKDANLKIKINTYEHWHFSCMKKMEV